MTSNDVIQLQEHGFYQLIDDAKDNILAERISRETYDPESPAPLLGVDWANRSRTAIVANYYIGAQWIEQQKCAIVVTPKISNLDFFSMFVTCLENKDPELQDKLSKIYTIDFGKPSIPVGANNFQLTPLLVAHFLILLDRLAQRGLKSNFIQREENLKAKVKGKVLLGQTMKKGFAIGRPDIVACRYQDYSIDCTENRILKKALVFAQQYLTTHRLMAKGVDLKVLAGKTAAYFADVSEDVPLQVVQQFRINPLFRDYAETIRLAKMLLRRFDYSIDTTYEIEIDHKVPPFWINMPILFELYVLGSLRERYGKDIQYHLSTHGNELDFAKLSEQFIIDTKYTDGWNTANEHDYIRQLSGYARNRQIRKKMGISPDDMSTVMPCMIVYPSTSGIRGFKKDKIFDESIDVVDRYIKFYKLGFQLPTR